MQDQTPLNNLSEADLIWIGAFTEALRRLAPPLAADDQGVIADGLAREAFEEPLLRALPPAQAAASWWRHRNQAR
jgi:hypothetical protein